MKQVKQDLSEVLDETDGVIKRIAKALENIKKLYIRIKTIKGKDAYNRNRSRTAIFLSSWRRSDSLNIKHFNFLLETHFREKNVVDGNDGKHQAFVGNKT